MGLRSRKLSGESCGSRLSTRLALAFGLSVAVLAVFFVVALPADTALAQETESLVAKKNLLDYIKDGGWIGHVILLCSVAGVSLTIAFAFQIRRDVLVPPELLGQVEELFENEEDEEVAVLAPA